MAVLLLRRRRRQLLLLFGGRGLMIEGLELAGEALHSLGDSLGEDDLAIRNGFSMEEAMEHSGT